MKISFVKYKNDLANYKMAKGLGFDVFEIDNPEDIDKTIDKLEEQKYTTIFIPNDLASFSEKMFSKYQYSDKFNIILTPSKEKDV